MANDMTWRMRINQEMQAVQNVAATIGMALVENDVTLASAHLDEAAERLDLESKRLRELSNKWLSEHATRER